MTIDIEQLAKALRASAGMSAKADIGRAASRLGLSGSSVVPVGDDCAAIPEGDGYLLLAIEGFMNAFVARDPWFAGWCGVMVNLSDVAAMGGRPIAVVDAVWAPGEDAAAPVLEGMRAAADRYGLPIVGGHTNLDCDRGQLAVAVLGRAKALLTSFDATAGDRLIAAIDLRGSYREPFDNWQAALDAPAERLRADLALLPEIAEAGLCRAAKDISQAGLVGTAAMLAECSGVGVEIDIDAIPKPSGVMLDRWLLTFPSFGYLLSVAPSDVGEVVGRFAARGIATADIGAVARGSEVRIASSGRHATVWDFSQRPLIGCARERIRMSGDPKLRVALLCHSVNPRGGVVHALELAEALAELGHEPVVHAPDPDGAGFFRQTSFDTVSVQARPVTGDTTAFVASRVEDYLVHFQRQAARRFDVFHAQDGISGNALATMKANRQINAFARTVHHLDDFSDARLAALQSRSVTTSDACFAVSNLWREELRKRFGLEATLVGNGVDLGRFRRDADGHEATLGARYGLGGGPIVLSVGGVEARKNTIALLSAFQQFRRLHRHAQLIIAGGASVLDHGRYRAQFDAALAESGLPADALILTGPVPDSDMPRLYRLADMLAIPSLREGFGLVVLEAMATGIPVVVSRTAPFTEYLGEMDVVWCEPLSTRSIADAMMVALGEPMRSRLADRGPRVAARHSWSASAQAHLDVYSRLKEAVHA